MILKRPILSKIFDKISQITKFNICPPHNIDQNTQKLLFIQSLTSVSTLNCNKGFSTLRNEHQLLKTTAQKQIELQTPEWSHYEEFKQHFKLRPIWEMYLYLLS